MPARTMEQALDFNSWQKTGDQLPDQAAPELPAALRPKQVVSFEQSPATRPRKPKKPAAEPKKWYYWNNIQKTMIEAESEQAAMAGAVRTGGTIYSAQTIDEAISQRAMDMPK